VMHGYDRRCVITHRRGEARVDRDIFFAKQAARPRCDFVRDVMVTMRDGVKRATDIYRPALGRTTLTSGTQRPECRH